MNDNLEIDDQRTKPKSRRQPKAKLLPRVTLAESESAYEDLLTRIETELAPKNVQQEGDALALGQLRWRMERLDLIETQTLNFYLLQSKIPTGAISNEERLTFAYRQAVCDDSFNQIQRNHLNTAKAMHHIAARIEKWNPTPRSAHAKRI